MDRPVYDIVREARQAKDQIDAQTTQSADALLQSLLEVPWRTEESQSQ